MIISQVSYRTNGPLVINREKSASVTTVIKHKLPNNNDTHFTAVFGCRDFGNSYSYFGFFYLKIGKFLHVSIGKGSGNRPQNLCRKLPGKPHSELTCMNRHSYITFRFIFSSPVRKYRKSYCSHVGVGVSVGVGVGVGVGVAQMLKFLV